MNQEKNTAQKKGNPFTSSKFKRGGMATLMSLVFIAIMVGLNIVVSLTTERFPSMNMDLTAQKLNSLSEEAIEVAKGVQNGTEIHIIATEDAVRQDKLFSGYGVKYSQVANLAEKMQEANPKISVRFVDPDTNPKFISEYPEDNLVTGKVLVKTDKRYKVLEVTDLFSVQQDQNTGATNSFSMVDSALANAISTVNLEKMPVVAVATGHGEILSTQNMGAFMSYLEDDNYEVKTVNFLTEELPENTQVVMIPTPTTDYTAEEITKLRTYLDDAETVTPISLLVTCHPSQGKLPKLQSFLEEWGVRTEEGVVAETSDTGYVLQNPSYVLVSPSQELLADNTYKNLLSPSSTPLTLLFEANNEITTRALWSTGDTAYIATEGMTEAPSKTDTLAVATMSTKLVQIGNSTVARNVLVFGSSMMFIDSFMGTSAFGDKAYMMDLMRYVTGTENGTTVLQSEQVQTNTLDISAPQGTINFLGLGVFTVGLPVIILAVGLVVFLKRRHL